MTTHRSMLEASIDAWKYKKELALFHKWDEIHMGVRTCPLCYTYNMGKDYIHRCWGCPVAEKTGKQVCEGTPYETALKSLQDLRNPKISERMKPTIAMNLIIAINAEIEYLQTLLKEELT